MEEKFAYVISCVNSDTWHHIPNGESKAEKLLNVITDHLNYSVHWEQIVTHYSKRRFFVNETFVRILNKENQYQRDEKSTIFMPAEKFYLPALEETKKEILKKFYIKTLDDLYEEHGRYQHSIATTQNPGDIFPN